MKYDTNCSLHSTIFKHTVMYDGLDSTFYHSVSRLCKVFTRQSTANSHGHFAVQKQHSLPNVWTKMYIPSLSAVLNRTRSEGCILSWNVMRGICIVAYSFGNCMRLSDQNLISASFVMSDSQKI